MSLIKLIEFNSLGDERGDLVSLEESRNIPFEIKRVYYLFNNKDSAPRGFHAHKKLKQVAICINGSCRFILDNGLEKKTYTLKSPKKGLLIESFVWREMYDFSEDCVLLVIASALYDESDYIRDYAEFISEVESGNV
ncbi:MULTISPECIES: sugar 3,4-ketoisomerase [unclassified Colwellia]|uniref:sugar 3,4-ketoisomerase n=1 Tax=unclassified Colwellia TaxID=196834 RepID=UPI0015F42252|nr:MULTISPECIES: FdtA/QdtA family cupin domain-containing protein [unclassified Colwellia]MBA6233482.1 WxcM-like domain-containing protein [Colwellia sp. MB02u-7]MBA6236572.1 WxcM-like domain-containing protein [Colwellia sp. MB02u-11]MBA6298029.1 WxcM-like domain-containing protein [Colwellia sp. MB3u-22]MBA6312147.1 WxcM-like domain-containing protein [Colwellia sp. MB3u-64]